MPIDERRQGDIAAAVTAHNVAGRGPLLPPAATRRAARPDGATVSSVPMPGLRAQLNERSNNVLNRASLPSDVIALVVCCWLRGDPPGSVPVRPQP
jgi:hypothetical protein